MSPTQNTTENLHLISESVTEHTERFLRVYDEQTETMRSNWMYRGSPQQDDKGIADRFAYLGHRQPRACDVLVPAGTLIKAWGWLSSDTVYKIEVTLSDEIEFTNDRALPTSAPHNPFTEKLNMLRKQLLKQECRFARLYDKKTFDMEGVWLFDPEQVSGKTPAQLKQFLGLPFVPTFICDAIAKPPSLMLAYVIPVTKGNIYQVEGGLSFSGERPLLTAGCTPKPQTGLLL